MVKHALRFCLLMLVASSSIIAAPLSIKSSITAIEKKKVDAFLNGRSALEINNYHSPDLDSIAPLEHILFRKAVLLGGIDAVFEDFIVPNSARARASVHNGSALASGGAHWHLYHPALSAHVLESDAVIASGTYEKGLYVTPDKQKRFHIKSRDDLQKLSAVTNSNWDVDWATLSGLQLANLYSVPTRESQFKMIEAGRADFSLQDFSSSPDLSIEEPLSHPWRQDSARWQSPLFYQQGLAAQPRCVRGAAKRTEDPQATRRNRPGAVRIRHHQPGGGELGSPQPLGLRLIL